MLLTLKMLCLLLYALALAGVGGVLPSGLATGFEFIALAVLVVHLFEAGVMFRYVRLYRGSLLISLGLTLLFGVLHLRSLAKRIKT